MLLTLPLLMLAGCDGTTARYNAALRLQIAGDAAGSVAEIERLAQAGHAPAQFDLAMLYATGRGLRADPRRSRYWIELAAKQGHVGAEYFLAESHARGGPFPPDRAGARAGFTRIAERGFVPAQYRLARLLVADGETAEALRWYELAAGNGHREAVLELAEIHERGLHGQRPDPAAAARWRERLRPKPF